VKAWFDVWADWCCATFQTSQPRTVLTLLVVRYGNGHNVGRGVIKAGRGAV